jgi:hypothetical protein
VTNRVTHCGKDSASFVKVTRKMRIEWTQIVHFVYLSTYGLPRIDLDQRPVRSAIEALLPRRCEAVVVLSHTRPEPMTGVLHRLDRDPARTCFLGYVSRGGTLDVAGMLFANRLSGTDFGLGAVRASPRR